MEPVSVTIYHDETKREDETRLKGHVLVFVPHVATWNDELPLFGAQSTTIYPIDHAPAEMWALRRDHSIESKRLHFSKLGGQKWTKYDAGHRAIADLAVDFLRCRPCQRFCVPYGIKVAAMFYGCDTDMSLYAGPRDERTLRHEETVLRILLKGAVHYLFPESVPIRLVELVTDGQPAHRSLSESRILWQLAAEGASGRTLLRSHVTLPPELILRSHNTDHKAYTQGSSEDRDAQFLQLADFFLGSISRSCFDVVTEWPQPPALGTTPVLKKDVIAHPVRSILLKQSRGAGFRHSSHYRTFSVGRVNFGSDAVSFTRLSSRTQDAALSAMQLDLSWGDDVA